MEYYPMEVEEEKEEFDWEEYRIPYKQLQEAMLLKSKDKWTWAEIAEKIGLKLEDLLYAKGQYDENMRHMDD